MTIEKLYVGMKPILTLISMKGVGASATVVIDTSNKIIMIDVDFIKKAEHNPQQYL
jgi:hypothetical protein